MFINALMSEGKILMRSYVFIKTKKKMPKPEINKKNEVGRVE